MNESVQSNVSNILNTIDVENYPCYTHSDTNIWIRMMFAGDLLRRAEGATSMPASRDGTFQANEPRTDETLKSLSMDTGGASAAGTNLSGQ